MSKKTVLSTVCFVFQREKGERDLFPLFFPENSRKEKRKGCCPSLNLPLLSFRCMSSKAALFKSLVFQRGRGEREENLFIFLIQREGEPVLHDCLSLPLLSLLLKWKSGGAILFKVFGHTERKRRQKGRDLFTQDFQREYGMRMRKKAVLLSVFNICHLSSNENLEGLVSQRGRGKKKENDFFTLFILRVDGEKEANPSFSQSSTFAFFICRFPVIGYPKRKARERGRDLCTLFAERIRNGKGCEK